MWKNLISPLTGTPPAAPNHNHGGDEDDDEGDDQTEEGGEEAFDGDEYWDAVEENDYSWICRACIGEIDSVTDKWQEIGRARVHEACLVCAICMQKTDHIGMIAHAPWFYCKSCMELALLEAKLRKGAEVWQYASPLCAAKVVWRRRPHARSLICELNPSSPAVR